METAISQDGCQRQEAGEQMASMGNEFEGEAQPPQGIVSEPSRTVDTTESKQVHVHITDSVHLLSVEICAASPLQTMPSVTSTPLSGQLSTPPCAEVSASVPVQPSASLKKQLTSPLSPSPPTTGMFTAIQAQTLDVTTFGQSGAAQPTPTVTRSHPPQEFLSLHEQMPVTQPTQTPPTIPAQSCASLAVRIFAPLPVQTPPPAQWVVDEEVGSRFDVCVDEVGVLERRRDELVRDLLQLEQPMMEAVRAVQAELAQAHGLLTRVQLQLLWLQVDVRKVKRKLLNVTRHCIQSQVDLSAMQYEVAQSVIMQVCLSSFHNMKFTDR